MPGRTLLIANLALAVAVGISTAGSVAAQDASLAPEVALDPGAPTGLEQLEAAFPDELVGRALEVTSFSGDEVIAAAEADDPVLELVDLAAAHGAGISDFSIASTSVRDSDRFIGLLAATIDGVPAVDVVDDLTRLILETDDQVEVSREVIAGREVARVGPGSGLTGDAVVYVVPIGEIAWYVVAEAADLEGIIASLPRP